jgi:hypothetical protein
MKIDMNFVPPPMQSTLGDSIDIEKSPRVLDSMMSTQIMCNISPEPRIAEYEISNLDKGEGQI